MNLAALFTAILFIAMSSQKLDINTLSFLTLFTGMLWLIEAFASTTVDIFRRRRD